MKALAFDQATARTGWAVGDENTDPRALRAAQSNHALFGTIKAPKREDFGERLAIIWREVNELIVQHEPEVIGYEEPFFPMQGRGGFKPKERYTPAAGFLAPSIDANPEGHDESSARFNPETLKQLQMVKGLIITTAALRGIPCFGCTPAQWRKTFLGYGRAPKGSSDDYMKQAVMRHCRSLGYEVTTSDPADAIGILHHLLHGPEASQRRQGDLLSMAGAKL